MQLVNNNRHTYTSFHVLRRWIHIFHSMYWQSQCRVGLVPTHWTHIHSEFLLPFYSGRRCYCAWWRHGSSQNLQLHDANKPSGGHHEPYVWRWGSTPGTVLESRGIITRNKGKMYLLRTQLLVRLLRVRSWTTVWFSYSPLRVVIEM